MRTVSVTLAAGIAKKVSVTGFYLTLIDASTPIDLEVETMGKAGNPDVSFGVREGYGEQFSEMFNSVTLTSSVAQVVKIGYSTGVVKFDRSTIITKQATSQVEIAPATVGVVPVNVLAADSTCQRIVFRADDNNTGDIHIGGAGVNTSNSTIVLGAGKTWVEERVSGADWFAVATAAGQLLRISKGL